MGERGANPTRDTMLAARTNSTDGAALTLNGTASASAMTRKKPKPSRTRSVILLTPENMFAPFVDVKQINRLLLLNKVQGLSALHSMNERLPMRAGRRSGAECERMGNRSVDMHYLLEPRVCNLPGFLCFGVQVYNEETCQKCAFLATSDERRKEANVYDLRLITTQPASRAAASAAATFQPCRLAAAPAILLTLAFTGLGTTSTSGLLTFRPGGAP